jgi:hypothetical protein
MDVEEYAALQAEITAALVSNVIRIVNLFRSPRLSPLDWRRLLEMLFPFVQEARLKSSELGRQFYDEQRELHNPNLPLNEVFLGEYKFEWFVEAMTASKDRFLEPGATEEEVAEIALRASKEVENGARKQIIRAVDLDDSRIVEGWARVATGRETCEFCLTMISRGPVYKSARSAGIRASDADARDLWLKGDDKAMEELMRRWHPGCDCKVVPVFDKFDWPGMDEAARALEIWNHFTREVNKNPKLRRPQNGNQNGMKFRWTKNQAIMAAIRRSLYSGDLDIRDFGVSTRSWRDAV